MHADPFHALGDPTRRHIIEVLRRGELPVNDIVGHAGIHQSGVSRHLRILHDAGFVSMRPEGQRHVYALRREPFEDLDRWLAPYRQLWEARLDRFEAAATRGRTATRPPSKTATTKKEPRR
jgi:DNA-binding transcriptional ArsR family regulator